MKNKATLTMLVLFCTLKISAQDATKKEKPLGWYFKEKEHFRLESEIEGYFRDVLEPEKNFGKVEAMIDWHDYYLRKKEKVNLSKQEHKKSNPLKPKKEKVNLLGIRYFNDANLHISKKDMTDLIWYAEAYYGKRLFQVGVEVGSVSGKEYLGIGPQFTIYDHGCFKRLAVNMRAWPSVTDPEPVFGAEYTSQELTNDRVTFSSTGMVRWILNTGQTVVQSSIWLSFADYENFYLGAEYEFNNEQKYNQFVKDSKNTIFVGIKVELK